MATRRRWQVVLATGAAVAMLCLILYALAQSILLPDYVRLERQDISQHVERVRDALLHDLDELSRQLNDWAAWDETYAFVATPSRAYIDSNLPAQTFSDLRLDAIAIVNRAGQIVYGQGYHRDAGTFTALSPGFRAQLMPPGTLVRHRSTASEVRGIVVLPEGPMLIASRPILTSERTGPVRGAMVWGRYFDPREVARLARTTHLAVTATTSFPARPPAATAGAAGARIDVQPLGDHTIKGSITLPDISGKPALTLAVTEPRTIVGRGRASIADFVLWFALVSLVFGAVTVSLYERLAASSRARRMSEERFRALIDYASPMAIFAVDLQGRVQTWNPAAERLFGWPARDTLFNLPPVLVPEGRATYEALSRQVTETGRPGEMETVLVTRDGTRIDASVTAAVLRGAEGGTEGMMVVVSDITARKAAEARIQRQLDRLHALRMIDTAITASLELKVTLDVLLDQVSAQLGVDAAAILLAEPLTGRLAFGAGRGFRTTALQYSYLRMGEGHAGRAALERRPVSVPDLPAEPGSLKMAPLLSAEGFVSYYAAPLIAKGEVKGVLEVFHRHLLPADQEWIDFLLTLASHAAIAIDNSALFNNLQRATMELTLAYDATLEGWSRALDLRDEETEGHTQRVTELTVRLAQAMGVPDDQLTHIRRGALLHDIGKMGIPDAVLLKPGPLTDAERKIIERHPTSAYALLSPIPYLRKAVDIPYCHHEKWDGTGYPRGLTGEQIPLAARIFAVVDVWDALTTDRPYRSAWPPQRALAYIIEQSGRHFDPTVVDAFVALGVVEPALVAQTPPPRP